MLVQLGAGGTQKHLILTGLRGVGKTVLLNEFEAKCDARRLAGGGPRACRIGKLPDAERRYMSAIASLGDRPKRTAEVAAAMGRGPQDVSVVRDRLIRASLLYAPRRGEIDFTVPLCADYLRRHPS